MHAAPSPRRAALTRIAVVTALAAYLLSAGWHVFFGAINPDEGFYAIAARAVLQGEVPYRDFGYTQMPLLPYANGPLLAVTGHGLFEQRWVNGLWGALALAMAARLLARQSSMLMVAGFVASFAAMPAWMYFIHLGKTYAFTSFVAMVAMSVFIEAAPGKRKIGLLGFLGVLAVGCRLPAAPFFAVLWSAAIWEAGPRQPATWLAGVGLVLISTAVLLGPFFLLAPDQMRFWTLDFHVASTPQRQHLGMRDALAAAGPAWWLAALVAGVLASSQWKKVRSPEAMVVLAAAVTFAANLLPRGVFGEYVVPFVVPFAAALVCLLARATDGWNASRRGALVSIFVATHLMVPPLLDPGRTAASGTGGISHWLPPGVPAFDPDLPVNLSRARHAVAAILPVGQPLIGPHIILAAETHRPVPRNLRLGPFAATMDSSPEEAARRHLVTYPELQSLFTDPHTPLLAFSTHGLWNYAWSMPSFRNPPVELRRQWLESFHRDFVVVAEGSGFWILARRSALPKTESWR